MEISVQSHSIVVDRSLRFHTIANSDYPKNLIFVLHGYGQLVSFFSKKFADLSLENTLLVFPEGMHRFYLEGSSGRVGASWMTKEWREIDIQENNLALNKLFDSLNEKYNFEFKSVLGFSQGSAVASRWISHFSPKIDAFISWASVFPPDIEEIDFSNFEFKRDFVLGNNDPYFSEETSVICCEKYQRMNFNIHKFDGKHEINIPLLKSLILSNLKS